jgi:N-acetylneuraminic acid mutarotase
VGSALYLWGGFSYTEPYTYRDGYRLYRKNGKWAWDELPALPSPSAWGGACAVGSKIYVLGGSDYDRRRFFTLTDRTGKIDRLGARLLVFDTEAPGAGWQPRTPCPGTPRCLTAAVVVDGALYFIGGVAVAGDTGKYCNVVDNWRYNPATDGWRRLRDAPMSGTGSSSSLIVFKNRYILLPCGYQYDSIMKPDGSIAPKYGNATKVKRTWENHPRFKGTSYFNHCYVYDTRTGLFGTATALPFDDVATITVVVDDTAYMFPGETAGFVWEGEYFGHHPEFVLEGKIRELDWEPRER